MCVLSLFLNQKKPFIEDLSGLLRFLAVVTKEGSKMTIRHLELP